MPKKIFQSLHDIQLKEVKVVELFIKSKQRPVQTVGVASAQFSISAEHGEYDAKNKSIHVLTTAEAGMDDITETPYSIRVRIVGFFSVDDEKFDSQNIDHWAKNNAPAILYPFLREHVYALTARCGFEPAILPLVVLPTLVPKKKTAATAKKTAVASQSNAG
ncbi:MAG: protein-export chaperone SecB [Syntrophobacteraceae bacterium]|nr:protein-export chaperone SecB [Syntrophobacteraceae bacterium]